MRQKRRSSREFDDDEDAIGEDLAAVNERLDTLTRQLERMAHANAEPRAATAPVHAAAPQPSSDHVADALARLDRRLDQVIQESRTAPRHAPPPRPAPQQYVPQYAPAPYGQQQHAPAQYIPSHPPQPAYAPPVPANRGPANNWAAQISARQHALDGGPAAAAPMPMAPVAIPAQPQWMPPDLSGLEHQLHQINTHISSLHQPYENAIGALRNDLAEIGRALTEAMPRRAIEALESEVRTLSERVDHTRQAGADGAALGALERELAEVRNALRGLTPAESLVGFEEAVRALSHKIDQIGASAQAPQDPLAFRQLEQAVVSLRGVVSNVASDGALAQLAAEVRGLGSQFERATTESSAEALAKLDERIASLMDSGRAVPPELEGSIRSLSERLDRMQLSQGDQLAFGALEDRIAKLSEKLDASDSRLGHLEAIERGLADLLVYLEEMRGNGSRGLRAPPHEPAPAPATPPPPAPIAPAAAPVPAMAQSPLDLIPEMPPQNMPAMQAPVPIPQPAPMPQPAPLQQFAPPPAPFAPPPQQQPPPRQMPRGPQRQPIDPNLPPDTPLEPGSGAPRIKPGSAAARIAASEAALGHARPMGAETGGKSAAITAARNAAKAAAYLDTPVKVPKSLGPKPPRAAWLKWPFKKAAKDTAFVPPPLAPTLPPAPTLPSMPTPISNLPPMPAPMSISAENGLDDAPRSGGNKVLKLLKTLLIAASVAIIVVGTAQTAMELLFPDDSAPATLPSKDQSKSPTEPASRAPATTPSRPMPTPEGALPITPQPADPEPTNSTRGNSFFDPSTAVKLPDVTGSIGRKPAPPKAPAAAPATHSSLDTLPASISPALRNAATANEPAAAYELRARYAAGRGVPQSLPDAVRWFERAAEAGFAPAQFRLASLNEKGDGVKKDAQAARRLYVAAASKGHAKAMHNLAVLYAEGIDGKPDYKMAAEWFRKAAGYGVTDSQYNLAILFARGIGMPINLTESYRWFALAAANGDPDAAKKRDEVAARLDQQTLTAAKLAVQTFVADREPEDATNLKAPPGGWDHTPAAPAKPRRHSPAAQAPAATAR